MIFCLMMYVHWELKCAWKPPYKSTNLVHKIVELLIGSSLYYSTLINDVIPNASESQTDPDTKLAVECSSLISVDELLDSVLETTHRVGRLSVSAATDIPYLEMAGNCEALKMWKQQKLSTFMAAQHRQENVIKFSTHECNQEKETPSFVAMGTPTSGNLFLDSNAISFNQSVGNGSMLCATEYQPYLQLMCRKRSVALVKIERRIGAKNQA